MIFGHLNLLFDDDDDEDDDDDDDDDDKHNKYCQVWKEILKTINGSHGEINAKKLGYLIMNPITIVIESLIEKNNIFYPEIALNHCSNEI